MGQRHLPKELRTRKINSLPEDLKGIAEELIAVKFDIREEIVTKKRSQPFRQEYPTAFNVGLSGDVDPEDIYRVRRVSPGVEASVDFATRERIYRTPIAEPTFRGIRDALYRLDEANAPRRNVKAFIGSGEFVRYLQRESDIAYHIAYNDRYRGKREYLGDIFGIPFFVVEGVATEIIAK